MQRFRIPSLKIRREGTSWHRYRRSGQALIFVLFSLLLVSALVVGLLIRAGSETRSSSSYVSSSRVRQLADMAVNLVQAQINHATSQGSTMAWASQPGAVRLYDSTGSLSLIYKLYSSDVLTTNMASELSNDIPDASWSSNPAIWTDINSSISLVVPSGTTTRTFYPVLDSRNPSNPTAMVSMEGFTVSTPTGWPSAQPVPPMPVRWLYVLQDGTMVTPTAGTGTGVVNLAGASSSNPVVGRIAFWTDDETCKININTASDGNNTSASSSTFWDTPRYNTTDEQARNSYQPVQGEYQRYPGHPATTTLQKVFQALVPGGVTSSQLFSVTPRYSLGGSQGGTVTSTVTIPAKTNRLYSSVGELLFDTNHNLNGGSPGIFTSQELETGKFFLTAHSSAPELTLFGTPRVCIWPISNSNDTSHRSATDQLISFCSTINGHSFYFTRSDPLSRTNDISIARNQTLLGYLDNLTSNPVPGYGGQFSSKYPVGSGPAGFTGMRQILTEIFDYIRMTNLSDPNVTSPYSPVWQTSTTDPSTNVRTWAETTFPNGGAVGQVSPSFNTSWNTRGLGRFPVLSEVSLLFVAMGQGVITGTTTAPILVDSRQGSVYGTGGQTPPNNTTAVQAFLLMNLFNPAQGLSQADTGVTVVVNGLDGFSLNGASLGMTKSATVTVTDFPPADLFNGISCAGIFDFRTFLAMRQLGQGSATLNNPLYSAILPIPYNPTTGTTTMILNAPSSGITFSVYAGNSANANLVQTYTIAFPNLNIPVPLISNTSDDVRLLGSSSANFTDSTATAPVDRVDLIRTGTTTNATENYRTIINTKYDTVVSMVPSQAWADYRLFAVAPNTGTATSIPSSAFVAHPNVSPTSRINYSSSDNIGLSYPSSVHGYLTYFLSAPITPKMTNPANYPSTQWDWDNALGGYVPPGPYINKADEGTANYYLLTGTDAPPSPTMFSANRQIPSAVMFGSLPTGFQTNPTTGWQTLLFRPGPPGHYGSTAPADKLLLDLFWMPVAQPYAISEPFATMGKVNMNYQIEPFTYIIRNTALRSVMAFEQAAEVKNSLTTSPSRVPLNLSDGVTDTDPGGTLRQFQNRFNGTGSYTSPDIFKSPSEICSIYLVPSGLSWTTDSAAQQSWYCTDGTSYFGGVGSNLRDKPYADIYPRLTTKSNCFKIYYTVQALQNPSTNAPGQWNQNNGVILGEQRGAATVERYIDPNDPNIPDFASTTVGSGTQTLENFYRWRIVESNTFPQ